MEAALSALEKCKATLKPEYLMPDDTKIGKVVKALQMDAADSVGGIEVYNDKILATSRR